MAEPMEAAYAQSEHQHLRPQMIEPTAFHGPLHDRDATLGQFFTPPEVAEQMAALAHQKGNESLRILDPGAGHGILSWFLCHHLLKTKTMKKLHVDLYEIDPKLSTIAERNIRPLIEAANALGVDATYRVQALDFLREKWAEGSPLNMESKKYDLIITNPPYYKIRKDSDYSVLGGQLIHGQPNVYALFLVLGARLLKEGGELIAIAPRSWLSGSYFRNLREEILRQLDLTDVQTFQNRSETFRHHKVLQETLIFRGVKVRKPHRPDIRIQVATTPIDGKSNIHNLQVPWITMTPQGNGSLVRVPESVEQLAALKELDSLGTTMENLGLRVTTGPVVAFRSRDLMADRKSKRVKYPLIWIDNVRRGFVDWPGSKEHRNPRWIAKEAIDRKLMIGGDELVLVRRFSAKEDRHRVIAAHLPKRQLGEYLGIENHVNVIRGFHGDSGSSWAAALSNYLNSELVDQYLRACSGTTQINASDLRSLPVPPVGELIRKWS